MDGRDVVLKADRLRVWYGTFLAIKDIDFEAQTNMVTALIGPSGCGKSTLLRSFNRMNDLIPGVKIEGSVEFRGQNMYDSAVDPTALRSRIGMVFPEAQPIPKVDLRQRSLRPSCQRLHGRHRRGRRTVRCIRPPCGRR